MKNGMAIKVESEIPVPPRRRKGEGIIAILRTMKVGQSVFVPFDVDKNPSRSASYALGVGNYTTRKQDDGVRIWRTA